MKLSFERPGEGQIDSELVWLLVLGAAGFVVGAWLLLHVPTPVCAFHALTGLPCPSCGGTRCLRSLLAGHFTAAFTWNPLVFLLSFVALAYGIYASAAMVLRFPRLRLRAISRGEGNLLRAVVGVAIAANWAYLIYHFSQLP